MEQGHQDINRLYSQINDLRELMISTGMKKGLDSAETLKYSQELDKLIIKVQLQNQN
ncbi:aspartyl-phosphate phosphatase Spo0E family protein [Domibacillus epiphyticus]|uniref:Spo0E family sporulation regulatory protein-aspartic acid phosphatase n=1 Tax=Domibacillus epiphyticus TaxID=1714355 RepID=A0A1V2A5G4_9BACI|nr:aspartyl-phosphate phosphatase Spo0E family protein [Domibacillus epiphyticus]OMP66170.1 hypothetical protein BTO28_13700 [Domibacillus epiphyticus]